MKILNISLSRVESETKTVANLWSCAVICNILRINRDSKCYICIAPAMNMPIYKYVVPVVCGVWGGGCVKYLIFLFLRPGVEAKRGVESRH